MNYPDPKGIGVFWRREINNNIMIIDDFKKTGTSFIVWQKRGETLTKKRIGKTPSIKNKIKVKDDHGK